MMMNSVSPTPEPTAGPTLPPDEVKNFTFTLNDTINKSQVCLRMSLGIAINITYNNSAGVCSVGDCYYHLLKLNCNFAAQYNKVGDIDQQQCQR